MGVKRVKRTNPSGKVREFWMIDISYTDQLTGEHRRIRKRATNQTRKGALQEELQILNAITSGVHNKKKEVMTLEEFSVEFMSNYAVTNNKPSEVNAKRSILRHHLIPAFGKLRLDKIGSREIERFKAKKVKDGLKPATINNRLTVLRKMLTTAQEWGIIETVPRFRWLRKPPPEFDFFDFDEADRLVAAAEPEWRTMILTALKTGLRLGELRALRWDDVDLVARKLVVRRNLVNGHYGTPKNGKSREIPLCDSLVAALKAHRHLKGELVFCDEYGDPVVQYTRHPLWRACQRAGLRKVRWHVLRHTFASHLAMRGASARSIQELMGHSTIRMTDRYMHLSPRANRDAVNLLDEKPPVDRQEELSRGQSPRCGKRNWQHMGTIEGADC